MRLLTLGFVALFLVAADSTIMHRFKRRIEEEEQTKVDESKHKGTNMEWDGPRPGEHEIVTGPKDELCVRNCALAPVQVRKCRRGEDGTDTCGGWVKMMGFCLDTTKFKDVRYGDTLEVEYSNFMNWNKVGPIPIIEDIFGSYVTLEGDMVRGVLYYFLWKPCGRCEAAEQFV